MFFLKEERKETAVEKETNPGMCRKKRGGAERRRKEGNHRLNTLRETTFRVGDSEERARGERRKNERGDSHLQHPHRNICDVWCGTAKQGKVHLHMPAAYQPA